MITIKRRTISSFIVSVSVLACASGVSAQSGTSIHEGDWPDHHGNKWAQRYSPLDQINADNVGSLEVAWRFNTDKIGPSPEFNNTSTPLAINGVLYATAGTTRNVLALDATSGQLLWLWRPREEPERFSSAPRKGAGRGVAHYRFGEEDRILTVTPGYQLVSLDAETGIPDPDFGKNGRIDLFEGLRNTDLGDFDDLDIGASMPPFVMNDVVVVGAAHSVGTRPRAKENVIGDVRGYDARTGEHLWTFHTIPEEGEYGYDTWLEGSAEYTGNTGVWAQISGDPDLNHVYLPVESPTSDYYGGHRPGDNLYGSSIVALDMTTGERQWHYQMVRSDIWDWDVPSAPVVANLPNGNRIVAQVTKQAWVYTFDRETGEPIWPFEDRPVPQGDVPGEWYAATQPFPTNPPPFDRQGFSEDDLIDFTPELREQALEAIMDFRMGENVFSPPSLANAPDGTRGTLSLPSSIGGANWEGAALDPETGKIYISSRTSARVLTLAKDEDSNLDYSGALGVRVPSVDGLPLVKPPYGRITAIDMNSGEHVWQIANADTPDNIADHAALEGVDIPRTGVATRAGMVLTKTLLFAGEGTGGPGSPIFRAYDKETGEIVAEVDLPNVQTGQPMTYEYDGKQYIAMFVSGGGGATELVALALP